MSFQISKSRSRRSRVRSRSAAHRAMDSLGTYLAAILIAGLTWISAIALLQTGRNIAASGLAPGQRAPSTVIATVDFECQDLAQTKLSMRQAADAVPPVFVVNMQPLNTAVRSLDKLFDRILRLRASQEAEATADADMETALADTLDLLEVSLEPDEVARLAPAGQEELVLDAVESALTEVWLAGILSPAEKQSSFQGTAAQGRILIRSIGDAAAVPEKVAALLTPEPAAEAVVDRVAERLPDARVPRRILARLLGPWLTPNLDYDPAATEELRAAAQRAVKPAYMRVREGTTLVERGKPVTPEILEQIRAHELRLSSLENKAERRLKLLGSSGILLLGLVSCVGLLRIVQPGILLDTRKLALLLTLSLLTLVPAKALVFLSTSTRLLPPGLVEFMTPLVLAPLLATVLVGSAVAVVLGLWTSFAAAILFGSSFSVFIVGLIATVLAAQAAGDVRKRSCLFRAGLWVGFGVMVYAVSQAGLTRPSLPILALQAGTALANGLLCAGVVLLLVPILELLFGITTGITLLEYSDLGNPLLQRLAKEAPGTYHHSLMVADLARSAALEVDANALLVRVCAYFHDIGKLTKPEFFAENQQFIENPHDDLAPSMSTLVIVAHVKEGVSLAHRHKLPEPIIRGIREHHGTGLISYFYHRARRQQEAEQSGGPRTPTRRINEGDFRYEGPKPSNREMGILLLADSVEAASRSVAKPTPGRIENLVNEIIDARVQDGQLDECGLTFADVSTIKRSFVFALGSMLHGRIEYPQDENQHKQQAENPPGERPETPKAHAVAHGAGAIA